MLKQTANIKTIFFFLIISLLSVRCEERFQAPVKVTELPSTEKRAGTTSITQLNNQQRRAFLRYYSPVIFKQAHEYDNDHLGYDWITNFHFDNDDNLANNKENWSKELDNFIDNSDHADWQIRPTIYSAIIEFFDNSLNTKSVILLYHVYHAKQRFSIHDWERVEIRIDGVEGGPGGNEEINYVVVTRHGLHNAREYPHEDLNFMETANGKHVMIWQADWDIGLLGTAELRFVEDSWNYVNNLKQNNSTAKVDINGSGRNRFHYIFVDQSDQEAVNFWGAQAISGANALSLTSGKSQGTSVKMDDVKKVKYELQDLADIIPSHLDNSNWTKVRKINLVDPVLDESGNPEIAAGTHDFYYQALDEQDSDEDRKGYIRKHWFWGVYYYGENGDSFYEQLDPQPWKQHLYFAHNGTRGNLTLQDELNNRGIFLGKGNYLNWIDDGGFDGRWVQLFDD